MSSAADLAEFVEAPGRFMEPSAGALVVQTPCFTGGLLELRRLEDVLSEA